MSRLADLEVLVAVLLVMQVHTGTSNPLIVKVVASYDPPHGFTENPPSYRAASPLTLTCEVEGEDQYSGLYYQWSSTCSGNCFTVGQYTKSVSTPYYLHYYDTGVHTCTVINYGALGRVGNASISVNVVGAGIFVPFGSVVLPNNSLITSGVVFHCLSGSSITNAGSLIGVEGDDITFSTSDPFLVMRPSYDPGTMHVRRAFRPLAESENGVYTFRTLDENGKIVEFHFGLYSNSNAGPPMIESLDYTLIEDSVQTLCCTTYSSPPTIVQWEKDGERLHPNSTDYQFSQILLERNTSSYKNTLTINGTIEDVVGEYSCRVSNTLGTSNKLNQSFKALEVSGHESPVLVGLSRSINCSTHLAVTRMEWVLVGMTEPVEEREDGGQGLSLSINPTDTGLDGSKYTCRVITKAGNTFQETIIVEVKEISHLVNIDGPSNPLSAGGKYTFTCIVTSNLAPSVKWLDPDNNEVNGSDVSMIMDEMVTDGNTTTLMLHFDPLKTSHGGIYACVSTISEPSSFKRMTRDLKVQITSDSTTVTRFPSNNTVLTGEKLTLTCVTTVNDAVDVPVQVSHQWVGPSGILSPYIYSVIEQVRVWGVTQSGHNYTSTVVFKYLRTSQPGTYNCSSTVTAAQASVFIASSVVTTASTSFSAGVGIFIKYAHSSSSGRLQGAQPSNTFVTVYRQHQNATLDMYCCSNATSANNAYIIAPTGDEHNDNFWQASVTTYSGNDTYAGCIRFGFYNVSYDTNFILNSHYEGIYTCKIPDSNGNYLYENFGVYNENFSNTLSIYQLEYTNIIRVLTCKTRYSPPASIKWYRDNRLLDIDGQTTNMSVIVTDRYSSSFDIILTVSCAGTYKCEAGNRLGTDTLTYTIQKLSIQCSSEFVVGYTVTCNCSSDFGTLSWYSKGILESNTGSLTVPVTTDSHGEIHTCFLSTSCSGFNQEYINITVTVPDQWATVSVCNSTGENALNNTDYTLTCTVTPIEGMTLPVSVEWVGPDGGVVASEGNVMMGEVEVQGTVSTLSLSFSPVFSSDAGSYICRAAISVPWMDNQLLQRSATVHMPVISLAMFQLKLYPVTLCVDWDLDKARDLERDIKREVEKVVRERCDCTFSSSAIHSGEFNCQFINNYNFNTYTIYRAVLNGTSDLLNADQLIQHLHDWRGTAGTLLYNNIFRLGLASDSECRVNIESFEDEGC